jgi:hypothetical protein
MRRWIALVLALAGCQGAATMDVALTTSPVLDEQPLAGVDTLELRWWRPGLAPVVDHVAWKQAAHVTVTAPTLVDGSVLELAAIAAGNVVAVGRTAPLQKGQKSASAYVGLVNQFVATPTARALSSARFGASAPVIGDGRVLLAGGATRGSPGAPDPSSISALVDLYDPAAGTFTVFAAAAFGERIYHAAGPTPDGGVLLVGGLGKFGPTDDIYKIDPKNSMSVGKLPAPRWGAASVTLGTGLLVLVGGYTTSDGKGGGTLATDALVVGPDGDVHSVPMPAPRAFAVATLLADKSANRILVSGGIDTTGVLDSAFIFEPDSSTFTPLAPASARASMLSPRIGHAAALLPSGDVLIFGGNDGQASVADAELWSPDAGGFVDSPLFNLDPRQRAAVAALADGTVLVVGGETAPQPMANPSAVLESIIFRDGTLGNEAGATPARAEATATTLPDGSILYAGGGIGDPRTLAGGAELFVPCFAACLAVTP